VSTFAFCMLLRSLLVTTQIGNVAGHQHTLHVEPGPAAESRYGSGHAFDFALAKSCGMLGASANAIGRPFPEQSSWGPCWVCWRGFGPWLLDEFSGSRDLAGTFCEAIGQRITAMLWRLWEPKHCTQNREQKHNLTLLTPIIRNGGRKAT
jgi:hypothetical protein